MKCSQCRKNDRELLTIWERFRDWCFRWFQQDIADLSQAKYTQGFSDGWVQGHTIAMRTKTLGELEQSVRDSDIILDA